MTEILDLDAVVPVSVTIKIDGVEIVVQPPTTANILALTVLSNKLEHPSLLTEDELQEVQKSLEIKIIDMIPGLIGKKLNHVQVLKLVGLLSKMSVPREAEELEMRGISPADPKAPEA